jgi:hypothetical protein
MQSSVYGLVPQHPTLPLSVTCSCSGAGPVFLMPSLTRQRKEVLLMARRVTWSHPLSAYRHIPLDLLPTHVNQWVITTNRSDWLQWNIVKVSCGRGGSWGRHGCGLAVELLSVAYDHRPTLHASSLKLPQTLWSLRILHQLRRGYSDVSKRCLNLRHCIK